MPPLMAEPGSANVPALVVTPIHVSTALCHPHGRRRSTWRSSRRCCATPRCARCRCSPRSRRAPYEDARGERHRGGDAGVVGVVRVGGSVDEPLLLDVAERVRGRGGGATNDAGRSRNGRWSGWTHGAAEAGRSTRWARGQPPTVSSGRRAQSVGEALFGRPFADRARDAVHEQVGGRPTPVFLPLIGGGDARSR